MAALRDRLVARPAFHRIVQALPFTRPIATRQTRGLFDVVAGFVYAQTLAALVELDVFARLSDGPRSSERLAAELALPERSVEVLLNAGAALGLVERRRGGWGLGLRGAAILGQAGIVEMIAHHRRLYADLADPVALLRGGKPTELARFWTYAAGEATGPPEPASGYSALMAASQAFIASAVLHNAPFRRAHHLLDLGGGTGAFAIAALEAHPGLRATVADRADVVPLAQAALRDAGVSTKADSIALDFFSDSLPCGADLVTLVRILHDHDDDRVLALLTNVATQLPAATLLVIEPLASRSSPSGLDAYFPWYFLAMGQGKLRTRGEIATLLKAAGYRKIRRLHSRNPTLTKALSARVSPD